MKTYTKPLSARDMDYNLDDDYQEMIDKQRRRDAEKIETIMYNQWIEQDSVLDSRVR